MDTTIRKGHEVLLTIDKLAFGGKGLARIEDLVVFVDGALPGQEVRARIVRRKRQFAEARCLAVVTQSPYYREPFCPHFGHCGGCMWQALPYEEQLRWKQVHVQECLEHLAGLTGLAVAATLPAAETIHYRNKMEFSYAERPWVPERVHVARGRPTVGELALGLHVRGSFNHILNIETCFLPSPRAVEILRTVREWSAASGVPAYNSRSHQGFWRFLVIREGKETGQTLVHVVTAAHPAGSNVVAALSEHLCARVPGITSLVHSVSRTKAQVAVGDETRVIHGAAAIEERIGAIRLRISAHSFFQTNTGGAATLYHTISRLAQLSGREIVWDLYSGIGGIAISLAARAQRVFGFEVVPQAVEDAERNCRLNGIDNCTFHLGDVLEMAQGEGAQGWVGTTPDVVITDPPRAGMHPRVVAGLLDLRPKRIIAVSCNPATLARDIAQLSSSYAVCHVQPVDLFPHTPHIECVVQLERLDSRR
jgi:23S rRNA (uracil1939-C5)-methyltransferase